LSLPSFHDIQNLANLLLTSAVREYGQQQTWDIVYVNKIWRWIAITPWRWPSTQWKPQRLWQAELTFIHN